MELEINDFSEMNKVSGEKSSPDYSVEDLTNMYIEGGNLHAIKASVETPPVFPEGIVPSIEIRGGPMEYMKFGKYWLMKWLDEDRNAKFYPVGAKLDTIIISQDAGNVGTNIYTLSGSTYDAHTVMKKSSWVCPAGIGNFTQLTGSGSYPWSGITGTDDLVKLAACVYGGYIYTSVNSGAAWTQRGTVQNWSAICGSADGTKLFACVYNGGVYRSIDSGVTWASINATARLYTSVAMSDDGTRLFLTVAGEGIYYSANANVTTPTFTLSSPMSYNKAWTSVCASTTGSVLYASTLFGGVWESTDYGVTWTRVFIGDWLGIKNVSCSSDGTAVCGAAENYAAGGGIIISLDSGANWNTRLGSGAWWSCAISKNGTAVIGIKANGTVYKSVGALADNKWDSIRIDNGYYGAVLSSDGTLAVIISNGELGYTASGPGNTWISSTSSLLYRGIACTADGSTAFAAVLEGYIYKTTDSGVTWTALTAAGSKYWQSIACSSDGTNIIACDELKIYVSADAGVSWTETAKEVRCVACSLDGTTMLAAVGEGYIYKTTDSGVTWTELTAAGSRTWRTVACSSDGTNIIACDELKIYVSADAGVSWTETAKEVRCVACSLDGTTMLAAVGEGYIYKTTDSGVTWTELTAAGSRTWRTVACSSDGTKIIACVRNGYIYKTTDSGVTWTELTAAGSKYWQSIACTADGSTAFAAVLEGYIYKTTDSGVTWTELTAAGSRTWRTIACSSDGTKIIACVQSGYIYKTTDSGVTWTELTAAGSRTWKAVACSSDGTTIYSIESYVFVSKFTYSIAGAVASGKMYSPSLVPDRSKYIQNPYSGYTDPTHFTSSVPLSAGKYIIFSDNTFEYITDIVNADTIEHMGVFYDNVSRKLSRMEVVAEQEIFGDLFTEAALPKNNDLLLSSKLITQFGPRMALANVTEMGATDICMNGDFSSAGASWVPSGGVTFPTAGGRTAVNCALITGSGSLNQPVASYPARLVFYAKGDVANLSGDFTIEADTLFPGWFRVIRNDILNGTISITYSGPSSITIDDITAYRITDNPAQIYISGAGTYQNFIDGGDIISFPANSDSIKGIQSSGQTLFIIKSDVTGTISETGDQSNPFATSEAAISGGGEYSFAIDGGFGIITPENGEYIIQIFSGSGYQTINEFWGAPYSRRDIKIGAYPVYAASLGDKTIITQLNTDTGNVYGVVVQGGSKVGGFNMGRMFGGMYNTNIVGPFTPEYRLRLLVTGGSSNEMRRFRRIKIQSESNIIHRVMAYPVITGAGIDHLGGNSYGLNFVSRRARFDIFPEPSVVDDIIIEQISLTLDNVMPEIKK